MEVELLIKRLKRIQERVSPEDIEVINETINYIKSNEEKHSIMRPNPLFGNGRR